MSISDTALVIVDYGMSNLRSVFKRFQRLGINAAISSDPLLIEGARKLVLPGVGHFAEGMKRLREMGLIEILNRRVLIDKVPILGICLGAQLFTRSSEEGDCAGLGWFDADTVRFQIKDKSRYKIPHMGWNSVKTVSSNSLTDRLAPDARFYFVHSFHFVCHDPKDIWLTSEYEYEFVSAIQKDNIYGVQFHPEKSHDSGFSLLREFALL